VRVVHAAAGGDDTIIEVVAQGAGDGYAVTVVTADRELRDRARRVGGDVVGPTWLLDRL
jgi:rRNA-processing protein FCF1